jgi:hypothetical protein
MLDDLFFILLEAIAVIIRPKYGFERACGCLVLSAIVLAGMALLFVLVPSRLFQQGYLK